MKPLRLILLLFAVHLSLFTAHSQLINPVKWSFKGPKEAQIGQTVDLVFKGQIQTGWHVYGPDFDPDLGPTVLKLEFENSPAYQLVGKPLPKGAQKKFDDLFGGDLTEWHGTAEVHQKVKILSGIKAINGTLDGQACDDITGKCVQITADFSFPITLSSSPVKSTQKPVNSSSNTRLIPDKSDSSEITKNAINRNKSTSQLTDSQSVTKFSTSATPLQDTHPSPQTTINPQTSNQQPATSNSSRSLLAFFLLAFSGGLIALLTPCIYPMIPMTVSFFTRSAGSRRKAIGMALIYGASIIAMFVLLGVLVSRLFGDEFNNFISTHWAPNLLFFALFVFFGFSFFGYYEITLPGSLTTATDARSEKGGLAGIFFMALTLVLVGFSCTAPVVGSILIASSKGEVLMPVIGMLGYSLAFALPFTLFAIFPQWLTSLPRSGGWLNGVKVVLGFIELAFALKFLSVADQTYHWGILDREVFLAIWIVIAILLGVYLLGKVRFPHDSPQQGGLHWLPFSLAIICFSFAAYLSPGLIGHPLKALAGFLPPQSTLDFDLSSTGNQASQSTTLSTLRSSLCAQPYYASFLHLPHKLEGYFDYNQALACAKAQNKPVFIDFTGHGCVNCREMEASVWSDPEVLKRLRENYVVLALYIDDKTELPEKQWYTSKRDGKVKKSLGKQNFDLQVSRFNYNAQPLYCLLDTSGNLLVQPRAYDLSIPGFVDYLDSGIKAFNGSLIN